jgi:hypothetical protein
MFDLFKIFFGILPFNSPQNYLLDAFLSHFLLAFEAVAALGNSYFICRVAALVVITLFHMVAFCQYFRKFLKKIFPKLTRMINFIAVCAEEVVNCLAHAAIAN